MAFFAINFSGRMPFSTELVMISTRPVRRQPVPLLGEAARRELVWLAPRDRAVDIRIRRPDVTVTCADTESAAAGA